MAAILFGLQYVSIIHFFVSCGILEIKLIIIILGIFILKNQQVKKMNFIICIVV